jgi:DNA topoisomerase-3
MRLVICEKQSVAKSISAVLGANKRGNGFFSGGGYIVSWCAGHLVELAAPEKYDEKYAKWRVDDLPIIPDKWIHGASKGKEAQLKILKELMNRADVEYVINACDAGREGELIFRLVYKYVKCTKNVKRLWISSLEEAVIRTGFDNLADGTEYDNLYAAASCRERADWLVGINATRLFSTLYNDTLHTGRVQSPTLAMVVKRDADIAGFTTKPFYTVEITNADITASSERFDDMAEADKVMNGCKEATVTDIKQTDKTIAPPLLYDLTTLQREANRVHGFTATQTLEYTQSLYEKTLISYPRTNSRYISEDMAASTMAIIKAYASSTSCNVSQLINNKKVTDHHAIIPTATGVKADLSSLSVGERKVLEMVINRLIFAVGDIHRYRETVVTLTSGGTEFKMTKKAVVYNGWKSNDVNTANDTDDYKNSLDLTIYLSTGQTFPITAAIKEGFTSPPRPHTEDTLLSAMESAGVDELEENVESRGLGTPATRASIIEKLVKTGLVERNKRNIISTEKGRSLITVLPKTLTSPKLTADWENRLLEIQNGKLTEQDFINNITSFIINIVKNNAKPISEFENLFNHKSSKKIKIKEPLGVCPRCGMAVREHKLSHYT